MRVRHAKTAHLRILHHGWSAACALGLRHGFGGFGCFFRCCCHLDSMQGYGMGTRVDALARFYIFIMWLHNYKSNDYFYGYINR